MKKKKKIFTCINLNQKKYLKQFLMASFLGMSVFFMSCNERKDIPPVEITLVSGWGGTYHSHEIMREIYEEFDRQHEDITLSFVPYSDNAVAVNKAIDMLAVGNEPDIVSTNGFSFYVEYAVRYGAALDLTPYIEADQELKSQIHPAVFEVWQNEQGELYTVPDALEVAGYWYNKELLIEAGIAKEDGEPVLPKDWTEFREMVVKVQQWIDENEKDISVFALEEDQIIGSFLSARLAGDSKEGLDAATSVQPQLTESMLQNVTDDIYFIQDYSSEVNNIEDARQKFMDGEAVFFFGGVWESDEFIKCSYKDAIGFSCYPTNNGESLSYVSASSGYVIAKQDSPKKTEACIRFLKYMLSKPVQEKIALMTSQAPSNPNISVELLTADNPLLGNSLKIAFEADIQIPTIYSVWEEADIELVRKIIENR